MRRGGYLVSDTPGHGREVGLGPLICDSSSQPLVRGLRLTLICPLSTSISFTLAGTWANQAEGNTRTVFRYYGLNG